MKISKHEVITATFSSVQVAGALATLYFTESETKKATKLTFENNATNSHYIYIYIYIYIAKVLSM